MELSREQVQTRFLALVLPVLTLSTHLLLSLSFAVSDDNETRAFWSLIYNGSAAFASILGLIGVVRLIPRLVSAYTLVHASTLTFVTLALVNILLPVNLPFPNPVIPSLQIDENAICRDIDSGLGWDDEWLDKCSRSFNMVQMFVGMAGLVLMVAQWWALATVRAWGQELQLQHWRKTEAADVEKSAHMGGDDGCAVDEKNAY